MNIKFCSIIAALFLYAPASLAQDPWTLTAGDRILVIAPHPDDETISSAGVIQEAVRRQIPVRVLYLTNGDSNHLSFLYYRKEFVLGRKKAVEMGELRQNEAVDAMRSLGLTDDQLIFLGYPDYGTLSVFKKFWRTQTPYRGALTRATAVPYQRSLTPRAPYTGESILNDFKKVFGEFKPTKIIVNHPADNNTDHQAAYLFTRVALWDLHEQLADVKVYTYMVHALGWPRPLGFHPSLRLEPDEHLHLKPDAWTSFELAPDQVDIKKRAVEFYRSQIPYKPNYLFTFVRANELFTLVSDVILEPQELNGQAWDYLDAAQQLRHENKKVDMRYQSVLRSVVFGLEAQELVVKIKLNQWSRLGFDINLYLMGYSPNVPFADMPKFRLAFTAEHNFVVYDGVKRMKVKDVHLKRSGNDFYVSIPLSLLNHPDRVLASSAVRVSNWPEEKSIWTVLRLNDGN